jgi:predicted transposase YbfD/YdcC
MGSGEGSVALLDHFAEVEDPRTRRSPHGLMELLLTAICAVLSGADNWAAVALWGRAKLDWLRQFLPFAHGIASHDTFGRVFALLNATVFERCFIGWMRTVCGAFDGLQVAVDGKTVRRSQTKGQKAIHVVSAFAHDLGVTLGQVKTAEKSNEIKAIPELLDALLLKGCLVTIDAMGCQKAIAAKIIQQESDYALLVKNNQPGLAAAIEGAFDAAERVGYRGVSHTRAEWIEKDHGRIETRRCTVLDDLSGVIDRLDGWAPAPRPCSGSTVPVNAMVSRARIGATTCVRGRPMPPRWGAWSAGTGALRITCIGHSTSSLVKIRPACVKAMRRRTSRSCGGSR